MRLRKQAICGLAMLAALLPAGSAAASTPDPATLKSALAGAPSSDYVEAADGTTGEGSFSASDYASRQTSDTAKRSLIQLRLSSDGFVTGYGRLWVKRAAGVALVEEILVFNDKSGAGKFFDSARLGDIADPHQTGTVDTSSIPNSYGVQDLISSEYAVAVVFAKGNDLVAVATVSATQYLQSDTVTQGQKAYSTAPEYTIQPASSAGTAAANQLASKAGAVIVDILLVALGLGILLAIIAFVVSRRRRPAMQPIAAGPTVQMSPDSRFWWDGSGWQDANALAPAHAQRTPDGAYWWDGQAWHQVPRPQ
jgi:hypothetical protein